MRQCIFWMEWKEEKKFNREHIILEALGGKGDKDICLKGIQCLSPFCRGQALDVLRLFLQMKA